MKHSEFSWKNQSGLKLFGQEWRPEGEVKAVVVLVHGLGEHSGRYAHVAEKFTAAGITLLSCDLQGHGRSEGVRGYMTSYPSTMDDITHLLDDARARFPGLPVFLYGHSMGGNLVLYYAIQRKPALAGIICTSPGLDTAAPVPAAKMFLGRIMYRLNPKMQMDNGLDRTGLSTDPQVEKVYSQDPLVHGTISAQLGMELIDAGKWIRAHAAEFPAIPLLLLQGESDRIVKPQATDEFAKNFKGDLTYKTFPGHYHELHNEPDRSETIGIMVDWINRHA